MFTDQLEDSLWIGILCLPLVCALCTGLSQRWTVARILIGAGLVGGVLLWLSTMLNHQQGDETALFYMTPIKATLLVLIYFIAFIVMRYAQANFSGDPDNKRFLRWLMLTVFSVLVTVGTNHLVVFWASWVGISLCLHQLLMFYPNRPRAVLAAHKKFILARFAEVLLASAFGLLYLQHHTVSIASIVSHYPMELNWQLHFAAVLLALVALIKCAQLPLHGWLIQVVESPTPVSSLLHAGVINMGGYLLILFSPLFDQSWLAKSLVLVVAGLSTVLASLILTTRISIKVRLAWSTTAQMGLMLCECALGLYSLAMLHLLAHSCYKAHAFLSSGTEVNALLKRELIGNPFPSAKAWGLALLSSALLVAATVFLVGSGLPFSPWLLVGLAIAQMLAWYFNETDLAFVGRGLLKAVVLICAYTFAKAVCKYWFADLPYSYNALADAWLCFLFLGLFSVYLFLQYHPSNPLARRVFIALNAGLYLDEWLTKQTLQWWPLYMPRTKLQPISLQVENI